MRFSFKGKNRGKESFYFIEHQKCSYKLAHYLIYNEHNRKHNFLNFFSALSAFSFASGSESSSVNSSLGSTNLNFPKAATNKLLLLPVDLSFTIGIINSASFLLCYN